MRVILKLLALSVLVIALISFRNFEIKDNDQVRNLKVHKVKFFDKQTFYSGVARAEKENRKIDYKIKGGIVPHHLFPGFIITDFFRTLSFQKPKTIILVGPNHYEKGNFNALTSLYGWQTPFGAVEPNTEIINNLAGSGLVKVNEDVLPKDHSVAGIMPFIKFYLPDTRVAPIILSGTMTQEETELLSDKLKNFINEDTIIIASVDFSHYLNNKQAEENDKITLNVIKNFDYKQLFKMNNDYVDSPPSIATLMFVMQKLGKTNLEVFYNTNSGQLQNNNFIETTSYFSIAFY